MKQLTRNRVLDADVGIFTVAVIFIGLTHQIALDERFVAILCYLAAVGSAYALVRRRGTGLARTVASNVVSRSGRMKQVLHDSVVFGKALGLASRVLTMLRPPHVACDICSPPTSVSVESSATSL